jgi:hypothetical protein
MTDLPRLYSFEELLASFPAEKMSERTLRGIVKRLYRPADGRRSFIFNADQIAHIKNVVDTEERGCVYFLRCDKYVKIGYSNQFVFRLAELQTGNPFPLIVYKTIPGTPRLERDLHKVFKHLRHQGEWFRWTRTIKDEIDKL